MADFIRAAYAFPFWALGWLGGVTVKGYRIAKAALIKGFQDGTL